MVFELYLLSLLYLLRGLITSTAFIHSSTTNLRYRSRNLEVINQYSLNIYIRLKYRTFSKLQELYVIYPRVRFFKIHNRIIVLHWTMYLGTLVQWTYMVHNMCILCFCGNLCLALFFQINFDNYTCCRGSETTQGANFKLCYNNVSNTRLFWITASCEYIIY